MKQKSDYFFISSFLCSIAFFSLYFLSNAYHDNEGVSLWCAFRTTIPQIIHPGLEVVTSCTYDHQPLYHLVLKLINYIYSLDYIIYRYVNFIFYFLTIFLFLKIRIKSGVDRLQVCLESFLFFSNLYLLKEVLQIRMYALYLLFSVLQYYYFTKSVKAQNITEFLIISIINGLTLFSSHATTFFLVIEYISKKKYSFTLKEKFLLSLLVISILYKIPYIYEWRFLVRQNYEIFITSSFFHSLINMNSISFLLLSAIILKTLLSNKIYILSKIYFAFLILTLLILKYLFKIPEIEARYILALPLIIILSSDYRISRSNLKAACVIILMCLDNYPKSEIEQIQRNLALRDTNFENRIIDFSRSRGTRICYEGENYYSFYLYKAIYLDLLHQIKISKCSDHNLTNDESVDFIVSAESSPSISPYLIKLETVTINHNERIYIFGK